MPKLKKHKLFSYERYSQTKPDIQKISGISIAVKTDDLKNFYNLGEIQLKIGSNNIDLKKPGYDNFQKDIADTYFFKTNITLGDLRKANIELLHNSRNKKIKYHLDNIEIMVQFPDSPYMVLYKNWKNIGWLSDEKSLYDRYSIVLQHGE